MGEYWNPNDDRIVVFLVVMHNEKTGKTISKFNEEEHILKAIGQMDNTLVERVFSVDDLGHTTHYDIVFEGKLKLKKVVI